MKELTLGQALFNITLWATMLLLNYKNIARRNAKQGSGYFMFIIIVSLFGTFPFVTGDYHSYEIYYQAYISVSKIKLGMEDFYYWLIDILPKDYSLWRLTVWGTATIVYALIIKRLELSIKFAALMFCLMLLFYFSALRNSLGYVVLYLSITYIIFPHNNKVLWILIGILGIVVSYFLHKSMFMYILLILFALLPLGKKCYVTSFIAFPIIYPLVYYYASLILVEAIANTDTIESGIRYLDSDFIDRGLNILGYLKTIIWRFPVLILMIYSIRNVFFKNEYIPYGYKVLLNYSYILVYISCLFMGQQVSVFITDRFYDAATFTLAIFYTYYLSTKPRTKFIKFCIYAMVFANIYNFGYKIYLIIR